MLFIRARYVCSANAICHLLWRDISRFWMRYVRFANVIFVGRGLAPAASLLQWEKVADTLWLTDEVSA